MLSFECTYERSVKLETRLTQRTATLNNIPVRRDTVHRMSHASVSGVRRLLIVS
jgi:hypothetical protein